MKHFKGWLLLQKTPSGWARCPTLTPFVYTSKSLADHQMKKDGIDNYRMIVPCVVSYEYPKKNKW